MRWRRLLLAVGAGTATSALATLVCEESSLLQWGSGTWRWYLQYMPAGVSTDAWWRAYMLIVGGTVGLPGAVVAILIATTGRKPRPGHCQACGYDLTGNTSGRCPECGVNC